jgi:hypothetical protein
MEIYRFLHLGQQGGCISRLMELGDMLLWRNCKKKAPLSLFKMERGYFRSAKFYNYSEIP